MPLDIRVSRAPNGYTNVGDAHPHGGMPMSYRAAFHEYMQDFDQFVAADWTITETQAGATQALAAGDGGRILLTNTAGAADINSIQKLPAAFSMAATKRTYIDVKFQASAIDFDILLGLLVVTATPFTTPTDGFFVQKLAAATAFTGHLRKDATTGATSLAIPNSTLVAATDIGLQLFYDGMGKVYMGVNGVLQATFDAPSTYFPDTVLTPTISIRNAQTTANTLTADLIYCAQER